MIIMDAYTRLTTVTILFIIIATISLTSCFADLDHMVCAESEKQALLSFKQGLKVPSNRLSSWDVEDDCCKWLEVVCNNFTGRVHELHLQNPDEKDFETIAEYEAFEKSKLGGEVKPSLLHLKHLSYLDLSGNDFAGIPIPRFLGSMTSIRCLNLSRAGFAGTVPHQIGNLSNLRFLSLEGDYGSMLEVENLHWLSGLSTLELLDLSYVKFQNDAPNWPQVINMLPSLVELHLSGCGLDHIPPLSNVNFTSLAVLDLFGNEFYSMIPRWIFSLSSLVSLNLGYTNFKGPIPDGFSNLTSLKVFDVSSNNIGPSLPNGLFSVNGLVSLNLHSCNLEGPIPGGLQNMTSLRDLDLSDNVLNSSIPNWLYSFRHLKSLDISSNDLQGVISSSIENWTSAVTLDLSYNKLNGRVPRAVGNLCNLRVLCLSGNRIGGHISELFKSLSGCISHALKSLWLDGNQLSGHLTSQLLQFKSLEDLSLGSNSISGPIPASLGNHCNLRSLDLSGNRIGGDISELFKNLSGCISYSLKTLLLDESQLSGHLTNQLEQFKSLENLCLRGNQLNGTLPESLGQLSKLEGLYISDNLLEGVVSEVHFSNLVSLKILYASGNRLVLKVGPNWIPPFQLEAIQLGSWNLGSQFPIWLRSQGGLQELDLSYNGISDSIPNWFWNLSRGLAYLNLSHNHFGGPLPPVSSTVYRLDLSNNVFSGDLFHFLCDRKDELNNLQDLYLEENLLSGEIPDCWKKWSLLVIIRLENNNLSGKIPSSLGYLSLLISLYLNNNNLSRKIPGSLGYLLQLRSLVLNNNSLSGW